MMSLEKIHENLLELGNRFESGTITGRHVRKHVKDANIWQAKSSLPSKIIFWKQVNN